MRTKSESLRFVKFGRPSFLRIEDVAIPESGDGEEPV